MRISDEILNKLINNSNKYHNKKASVDNIKFDSIKESKRYNQLKILEKANLISELELQKKFELQPSYINNKGEKIRAIYYIADFYYYDELKNKYIVEDTKGYRTEVYKVKKKIFEYKFSNLTIDEI